MPSKSRVDEFVSVVVAENHVEAIEKFYHKSASMRENLDTPREGRDNLVAHERAALKRVKSTHTHEPTLILIDGDNVAIHWVFDFTTTKDEVRRLEEISIQKWRGDRIAEEQFFYDSATAWHLVEDE